MMLFSWSQASFQKIKTNAKRLQIRSTRETAPDKAPADVINCVPIIRTSRVDRYRSCGCFHVFGGVVLSGS